MQLDLHSEKKLSIKHHKYAFVLLERELLRSMF